MQELVRQVIERLELRPHPRADLWSSSRSRELQHAIGSTRIENPCRRGRKDQRSQCLPVSSVYGVT